MLFRSSHSFPLWGFFSTSFGKSSFVQPVFVPGGREWKLYSTFTEPVFPPGRNLRFSRVNFAGQVENGRALDSKVATGAQIC